MSHYMYTHNHACTHTHMHAVPPSPPLNLRLVSSCSTTVTLAWEEPVSTGGRNRSELRYNLWIRTAGETRIRRSSTVTTTTGVIGGTYTACTYTLAMNLGCLIYSQHRDLNHDNHMYPLPSTQDCLQTLSTQCL